MDRTGRSVSLMDDKKTVKRELEKKVLVLRQLEGVYKTTTDTLQKKRVSGEIRKLKMSIKELQESLPAAKVSEPASGEEDTNRNGFPLFSSGDAGEKETIRDAEIKRINAYARFLENNYLPLMSEYYLKIDFNYALQRDSFYPRYMDLKKYLKEYEQEVESQDKEARPEMPLKKDKSAVHKARQRYLLALDKILKDLRAFLAILLDDLAGDGIIVLEPDDTISIGNFDCERKLEGCKVRNALKEMHEFVDEFTRYINIPNL